MAEAVRYEATRSSRSNEEPTCERRKHATDNCVVRQPGSDAACKWAARSKVSSPAGSVDMVASWGFMTWRERSEWLRASRWGFLRQQLLAEAREAADKAEGKRMVVLRNEAARGVAALSRDLSNLHQVVERVMHLTAADVAGPAEPPPAEGGHGG